MKHLKLFLIYAVASVFVLFLAASFGAGNYMSNAYMVNLDSKILYYAFAGNLADYVEGKVDDGKSSIQRLREKHGI